MKITVAGIYNRLSDLDDGSGDLGTIVREYLGANGDVYTYGQAVADIRAIVDEARSGKTGVTFLCEEDTLEDSVTK